MKPLLPLILLLSSCYQVDTKNDLDVDGDGDGLTEFDGDCDDSDATIYPGADELCDGLDNDCDTQVDEEPTGAADWFRDADGDGYGAVDNSQAACEAPTGFVADATDCDDLDAEVSPAGTESCNDLDDDCDGETDEADAVDAATWYADTDGDGYGDAASTLVACDGGTSHVADNTDCDDAVATSYSGADEVCNGVDDNCDGAALTWYADTDADTYGDAAATHVSCVVPPGYVADDTDCNDGDSGLGDVGLDGDCDGVLTGDDCDDGDSGSTVVATDGDCDGVLTGDDCDDGDAGLGDVGLDGDCDGVLSWEDCDDSDATVGTCWICPSGRFGYWSFNETSGSVAADSFGNNDATAQGAVPFANGIHGYARDLGGQSNAQYLDFPQAVGDATMGAQTISFWIRTNSGTAQHGRHLYTTSSSQSSPGQYIREYGHYIDWNVTNGSSYCINAASTSSASLTANTWHHIALTWDGQSGGTYSIYVDGQLDVSGTASCSQSGSATAPPALGSLENGTCGGSGVQCTDGQIDEFGVWDLALSAAEVQDIYQGGCEPTPPALDPLDTDDDGDGYTENEGDCDDTDPNVTCISCGNSTLVSGEVCLSTATIFSGSTRYLSADLTTNWTCTSTGNHAIDEAAAFCLDNGFSSGRVVDTSGSYDYVYSYCTNGSNGGIYSGHGSANIVVQREVACQ